MSRGKIGRRFGHPLVGALAMGLAWVCGLAPALAADAHTSAEDRARFVAITRQLETAPLQENLQKDRAWAMRWLIAAPDISVTVCGSVAAFEDSYPHNSDILAVYAFSMAAKIIEHPETASDVEAQQLTGVEALLKAYEAILKNAPTAKSPALERLQDAQARGELPQRVREAYASCLAAAKSGSTGTTGG